MHDNSSKQNYQTLLIFSLGKSDSLQTMEVLGIETDEDFNSKFTVNSRSKKLLADETNERSSYGRKRLKTFHDEIESAFLKSDTRVHELQIQGV